MNTVKNLHQEYSACQRCPVLVKNRTQVVFGNGNPKAQIIFIGEAPGAEEDKQGIPFCGAAGKILNELLASVNLSREDIFVTNTILCRPPSNRNPEVEEMNNCSDRLNSLIKIMKPKVIVTIGNFATERILGKKGITSIHGKIFSKMINNEEIKIIPVIHPANYLYQGRNPQLLESMKQDFKTIKEVIEEIPPFLSLYL
jgi:DNA polymerase